jgi:hypothetical protein
MKMIVNMKLVYMITISDYDYDVVAVSRI